jgi:hypothetical protein
MIHGRRRENIFLDSKDYETFIRLLQETDERWGLRCNGTIMSFIHKSRLFELPP